MNAKQRRRERLRASAIEREQDARLMRKIAVIATGCSSNVFRAVTAPSARSVADPSADNMCLGQVAIFAAGFRKPTESVTAR